MNTPILIITLCFWLLILIPLPDRHKFEKRTLLIIRNFFIVRYRIPIDMIVKVYKTNNPDEFLLGNRRRGIGMVADGYIQIEFTEKNELKNTFVTPINSLLFMKQLELIKNDSTICGFKKPQTNILYYKKLGCFIVSIMIALVLSRLITFTHYYALLPFILPISEILFFKWLFRNWSNRIYEEYCDNLEKYVIRN